MARSKPAKRQRRLTQAERRAAMPPRVRMLTDTVGGLGFGVAAGFLARGPAAMSWPLTLAVGAAAAVIFVLWRIVPRFVLTGIVLAVWLVVIPLVTWLFTAVAPEFGLDYQGKIAALGLYALLVAGLAHRTSRGRPWLTTALALLAVTAVTAAGYRFNWRGGVWIAYGAGMLVIVLRAGFGSWLRDTVDQVAEWWSTRSNRRIDLARWRDVRGAELATAATLTRLPEDYSVIHDRTIPGSVEDSYTIDHIVIGPTCIAVLASIKLSDGPITRRRDGSLWHQRRSLDKPLRECWWQARVVESRIDLPTVAILVVQGPAQLEEPLHIGLYDHQGYQDETLAGAVSLVHGSADDGAQLIAALTAGGSGGRRGQVKRYTRRIGKAFPAGQLTEPSGWDERASIAALWPAEAVPYALNGADEADDTGDPVGEPQTAAQPPTEALTGPVAVADAEVLPESDDQPPVAGVDQPAEPYPGDPAQAPAEAAAPAEHREYQWDGGQEADDRATAGLDDITDCTLKPGDRVNALRPDGMLIGWVVLAEPYIHADGMPVVDIADHADYLAAQKHGDLPEHYLAEPLGHLMAVEPS